jgi:inner membrane transporter RhtA
VAKALPRRERIPPHLYFVGSAIFHYLGPSFAVLLFARVPVAGVAWLRISSAALVFSLWRHPWRAWSAMDLPARRMTVALGIVFALMNYSFYIAIDRLPLGTVAAIEFVGPVVLAAIGVRSRRNLIALALTTAGVYLITDLRLPAEPTGLMWAFLNAVLFTLYIVLAHRVSRLDATTSPLDRLGASMLVAMIAITPLGIGAIPVLGDPVAIAAGIGVGVTSSVIPYVFDQMAMMRLPRSTYALLVALLPATAVVMGFVLLGQVPAQIELVAVAMVVIGVLIHRDAAPTDETGLSVEARPGCARPALVGDR